MKPAATFISLGPNAENPEYWGSADNAEDAVKKMVEIGGSADEYALLLILGVRSEQVEMNEHAEVVWQLCPDLTPDGGCPHDPGCHRGVARRTHTHTENRTTEALEREKCSP